MSVITFVCAGQMNSAITFPAFENGHEVRSRITFRQRYH